MKRFLLFLSLGMVTLAIYMPGEEFPQDIFNISDERIAEKAATWPWCDEEGVLPCLTVTPEWYNILRRPINLLPQTRREINTTFILNTKGIAQNQDFYIWANKSVIDQSPFDANEKTAFVTHGFTSSANMPWVINIRDALISYGYHNVIRVNWKTGEIALQYFQDVANARVVGLEIAHLVNFLAEEYGLDRSKVHLLGHSLASHISGYAGERIPGLGRISGLDPAGPLFAGMPSVVRLDPSDAIFVDVIHTDIIILGMKDPSGHLDFYPNSGGTQPGCTLRYGSKGSWVTQDVEEAERVYRFCSHGRVCDLYTESLKNGKCSLIGYECPSYEAFTEGQCASCGADNSNCSYMGIRADEYPFKTRENVKMYLKTDDDSPFCQFQYQVVVDLASPIEASPVVKGRLIMWFGARNGSINRINITENRALLHHGKEEKFLFTSDLDITNVTSIIVYWQSINRADLYINSITVSPLNHIPESERLAATSECCGSGGHVTKIRSSRITYLTANGSC